MHARFLVLFGLAYLAHGLAACGTAPAALFTTQRAVVAPVFYPCSHSFTKYVAEQIGIDRLVALFPAL